MASAALGEEVLASETKALWVFAYGSLCWKPGFEFRKAVAGRVEGFHRRFWQGNTTHRGTEDRPGRVATLVENSNGNVHGIAYAITGEAAIPYLSQRECEMGGYTTLFTTFYPAHGVPFKVLLYVATPLNPLWLGEAEHIDIAAQIVESQGASGHNVEYVLRLAQFMRDHFPGCDDEHLFGVEGAVRRLAKGRGLCVRSLMGDGVGCVRFVKEERRHSTESVEGRQGRVETFEHTTRVPEKTLRCLNI